MPRDWHPLRFFARDNGRPQPTILFWLFFVPVLTIVLAGCYLTLDRRAEQQTAEAALTKTLTPAATATALSDETATPRPPTVEPTATEFVYDDPSDWEFVEKTDPAGTTYLDLQDWQKEQVWHAFGTYWDLWYRSEDGLTPYEEVEKYITGSFADGVRTGYETSLELGEYVYMTRPLSEISRAMVLESAEDGNVKVKVVLASDFGFEIERRHNDTGEVLETNRRFSYKTWSFILSYLDGIWAIEETSVTELN